jgi:hypothetical protein
VVGKALLDADNFTWVPVPLRLIFCGLAPPLSLIETDADRVPDAVGAKVTEIVQLAPAATLLPHVLVWWKSDALVPVTPTPMMDSAALPEFETVIVWATLVVLTS